MKKILSSLFLFGATTFVVFAQTGTTTAPSTTVVQEAKVSAGFTPESPFYFFDKITESLQELLTFTTDAKIKLQLSFASERVAEAKAMLAEQGDHKTGLDVVNSSIVENVQKTSNILKSEKLSGKDVSKLAKEADDQFDSEERELNKTLAEVHKEVVEKKIESYKALLEEAKITKDAIKIQEAEQNLLENKQIAQDLKVKKEEIKKSFRDEKKSIEEEMSEEDQEKDEIESKNEDIEDEEDIEEAEDIEDEEDVEDVEKAEDIEEAKGDKDIQKKILDVKNEDSKREGTEARDANREND